MCEKSTRFFRISNNLRFPSASGTASQEVQQDETTGHYLPNGARAKSGLNKSIVDAGWQQFITYCEYKAADAGTRVVKVDPKYISQICSGCGAVVKKKLSERWHSCECGCELDRDHNAAINIGTLGLKALA